MQRYAIASFIGGTSWSLERHDNSRSFNWYDGKDVMTIDLESVTEALEYIVRLVSLTSLTISRKGEL